MPDIPQRYLDNKSINADKLAREKSALYWSHPTTTVYEYLRMSRAEQERVNAECRTIEQRKQASK